MLKMAFGFYSAGIVCALVGLLVYINTLDCGMMFDDEPAIKWNQDLRSHRPWPSLLRHDFWGTPLDNPTSHKSYRPLTVATFRLNYLLHELQPMGYHLVNVLLHSAVCYLYVQLCGVVFSAVWPALIAGLLFAVHPIHTEAVAGLVGRAESVSAIFFLASFLCYRRATLSTSSSCSSLGWLVGSLLLGLCSMVGKEQGITVIAFCLTYDFFIVHKMDLQSTHKMLEDLKLSRRLKEFLKRGLTLGIFALCAIMLRITVTNGGPDQKVFNRFVNPPTALESPYRQLSWMHLSFINSWLLLNPSHLSADWRFGAAPVITSLLDPHNLLTFVTFVTVALLTIYGLAGSGHRQKTMLFGISLTVFPYIPASNLFFPVGFVIAERVLYLPSMGFCMLVGYGAWNLLQRANTRLLKGLLTLAVAYLIAAHSLKTLWRNREWYSSVTMYSSGVRFNPKSGLMLSNLGIEYALTRDYLNAESLYRTSMGVAPNYSRGFYNLGKLLKITHRYREAEEPLRRAIELGNVDTSAEKVAESHYLLISVVSTNPSRFEEALGMCNSAISVLPHHAKLYAVKGGILLKMNRTSEALSVLEEAVRINSGIASVHYNLGVAHMKLGNQARAERAFRDCLLIDHDSTHAMFHLATVLQNSGDTEDLLEAEKLWLQVVLLEPHNTNALLNLAQVYYNLEHHWKTVEVLQRILKLAPLHKGALHLLGHVYYRMERYSETVTVLERLIQEDPEYSDATTLLNMAQRHILQER